MAITRHSNFDKTVNTINDRNLISNKVNGMMVVVLDAIADPNAGSGKAIYRWESSDASWILVSKSTTETMNFVTEELTIVNGGVQLSYIPVDNTIWNGVILNGSLIYADLNLNTVTIAAGKITGLTSDVNGMILRVTYAYGTISQQITTVIEESVDAALVNSLKTINGQEIIGTGNIEVTADLPDMKTINNVSILGTGNIDIVTDISMKADKINTYTKTEVDAKIVELAPATDISMKADVVYVDNKISDLIDLAPAQLDTFKEIADKLVTDEGVVSALTTVVSNKVDKVPGKGLSTEDFSTAEKAKLAGLSNYIKPTSEPISYIDGLQTTLDNIGFVISSSEFNTGNKRGLNDIFGIEVDVGNLPNATTKEVSFTFNQTYTYWIDNSNSYCSDDVSSYPLNYTGNIGESISCYLDILNNKIKISCSNNKTSFTGNLVILYTK